jgi:hypothetical protein
MSKRFEAFIDTVDAKIDNALPQSAEAIRRRKNRILRPLGAVAGLALVGGAAFATHEALSAPTFSETSTTYTIGQGEGTWDAAEQVEGSATVNMQDVVGYIESMPVNHDVLEDGLQPGESLEIPESVTR